MALKKPTRQHVNNERWMVSFADFMTLLFALFVVLFAISSVDEDKLKKVADSMEKAFGVMPSQGNSLLNQSQSAGQPTVIPPVMSHSVHTMTSLKKKLESELKKAGVKEGKLTVRKEARGFVIQLSEKLLFDVGSARLKPQATPILKKLTESLAGFNSAIRVEGHTDNMTFRGALTNWELSAARSSHVLQVMLNSKKIPPARLSMAAYGEYKPIASNKTIAGRAQNRRVDIVILNAEAEKNEPPKVSLSNQTSLKEELDAKINSRKEP